MIKVDAVRLVKPEPMMITWDVGRRCNYDCSYCEISRHDNISKFHSIDEYLKTFGFIKQWTNTYNSNRKEKVSTTATTQRTPARATSESIEAFYDGKSNITQSNQYLSE